MELWSTPEFSDEAGDKEVQVIIDSGLSSPITLSGSETYYMSAKAGFKLALICTINTTSPSEVVDTTNDRDWERINHYQ